MKLNAKFIIAILITAGIFTIGFVSYVQIQPTNAQSADFPGLNKLPGFDIFKDLFSGDNNNNPSASSNEEYLDIDKAVVAKAANNV